jgi:hypothetical protein
MEQREATIERLKRLLVPSTLGGWVLAVFLLLLVLCAWAYSARDALFKTYRGMQPGADPGPALAASEKLELKKTASGARVTLTWIYAEENYVSMGFGVENLKEGRRAAGHPVDLDPLLGFEPLRRRQEEYLRKHGLGTDHVDLTDQSDTNFRVVESVGTSSESPDNMGKGPLQHNVAFKPEEGLEPSEDHRFRLEVPLVEQPVVSLEEKQLPPEPFPGEPFVFEFEIPVHAVPMVEVNEKATAEGVTLTLDRVLNSPGRPQAVVCYELPDDEHSWTLHGGEGSLEGGHNKSGWTGSGDITYNPPGKCQNLMLKAPVEGRSSVEVGMIEGYRDCPSGNDEAAEACLNAEPERIEGPWRFEFEVPNP